MRSAPVAQSPGHRLVAPLLALALALGGCRGAPNLGGKLCTPDAGDCGASLSCTTRSVDGSPLGLPAPGGLCVPSPLDCDITKTTCPSDAGMWICAPREDPSGGCFDTGAEQLGGSVCMVGVGVCRTYGFFQWNDDGGDCVLPAGANPASHASPECVDAGGAGLLCRCDGLDQDCSGTADDFPPAVANLGLEPSAVLFSGAGCVPDGGPRLVLEPSGLDGGQLLGGVRVDSCVALTLGHGYSLSELDTGVRDTPAGTCGASFTGTEPSLLLFAELADGGATALGGGDIKGSLVPMTFPPGNYSRFLLCLPANAGKPFWMTSAVAKRDLSAGHCDLP